jgi:hypothetical protein
MLHAGLDLSRGKVDVCLGFQLATVAVDSTREGA